MRRAITSVLTLVIAVVSAGLGACSSDANASITEKTHVVCGTTDSINAKTMGSYIATVTYTFVYFDDSRVLLLVGTPEITVAKKKMYAFTVGPVDNQGVYPLVRTRIAKSCDGTEIYNDSTPPNATAKK
jgi:hypothetical protein